MNLSLETNQSYCPGKTREERPERKCHRVTHRKREMESFGGKPKTRRKNRCVCVCMCLWGGGGSYIIIIPLSNGRAASPGEFVLNGRFARRTGQRERERERNGFQSAGNPVYIYIIISTLTPSFSLLLSFLGLFKKKKKKTRKKQTREGFRLLLVNVC